MSRGKLATGCPVCARGGLHSDGRNSMAVTHPELAKEYQGDATKIIAGTHQILDWKCSTCGYKWQASGTNRERGTGCRPCSKSGYNPTRIGYLYIHHYTDGKNDWIKCGITNVPESRIKDLRRRANKYNIEIIELEIYKFDDGKIPENCERELLDMSKIRYNANYDIEGKNEFFKYEALDLIKKFIDKW